MKIQNSDLLKYFPIIVFILLSSSTIAQFTSKADSLKHLISMHPNNDSIQIENLLKLGDEYEYSFQDTALFYYSQALEIANTISAKKYASKCLNYIGIVYSRKCQYTEALTAYNQAIRINKEIGNTKSIGKNLINIGLVYKDKSNYPKALEYFQKALKINEEIGNGRTRADNYVNIGLLYKELGNLDEALSYYQKALALYNEFGNIGHIAIAQTNIGTIYHEQGDYSRALEYYRRALERYKEIDYHTGIANIYINIGILYHNQKKYDTALSYYQKALALYKKFDEKKSIPLCLAKIASLYKSKGDFQAAINIANQALETSTVIGDLTTQAIAYYIISEAKYGLGNYKSAIRYRDLWVEIKDSILNNEKIEALADLQTRYETEKKEKQIIKQKAEIDKKQQEIIRREIEEKSQKKLRNALIIAFVLAVVLMIIMVLLFIQKNKANILMREKKEEIDTKNTILKDKNRALTETLRIVEKQKNEIHTQNDKILAINKDLEEKKLHLEQANATKNKFFSIIAHDLLNPFNSILGLANILMEEYRDLDDQEREDIIKSLANSSQSVFNLVENLLKWSRSQTGNIHLKLESWDVNIFVNNALIYVEDFAKMKNIKVSSSLSESFNLKADKDMLQTILRNLCSNAVKFTPDHGNIQINAWRTPKEVFFSVEDSGVGMSKEKQEVLFDITQKTSTPGTNKERGTGLGLILCKEFVEKHGGEIWVESEVNKGSKFIFSLPQDSNN